jgi:hypothetical protein
MRDAIEPPKWDTPDTLLPSSGTRSVIPISAEDGFELGDSEPAANYEPSTEPPTSTSTTTSRPSTPPTGSSKRHWRRPQDAKRFASQMRAVATMLLNGEIDIDTARAYGALARAVVQALSVSVTQSRFSRVVPDLNFDDDLFDEEDDDVSSMPEPFQREADLSPPQGES